MLFSTTSRPLFLEQAINILTAFNVPENSARVLAGYVSIAGGVVTYGKHVAIRRIAVERPSAPLDDPKPDILIAFTDDVDTLPADWHPFRKASG